MVASFAVAPSVVASNAVALDVIPMVEVARSVVVPAEGLVKLDATAAALEDQNLADCRFVAVVEQIDAEEAAGEPVVAATAVAAAVYFPAAIAAAPAAVSVEQTT